MCALRRSGLRRSLFLPGPIIGSPDVLCRISAVVPLLIPARCVAVFHNWKVYDKEMSIQSRILDALSVEVWKLRQPQMVWIRIYCDLLYNGNNGGDQGTVGEEVDGAVGEA